MRRSIAAVGSMPFRSTQRASVHAKAGEANLARSKTRASVVDRLLGARENSILNTGDLHLQIQRMQSVMTEDQEEQGLQVAQKLVNSPFFSVGCALIIMSNAVQIGLETEDVDDTVDWQPINYAYLGVYTSEILLRFAANPRSFLSGKDPWVVFDTVIVLLGLIDTLVSRFWATGDSIAVLRIVRLCKLARIFRLFRFCQELWLLVASIATALKTVVWMWILLGLVIYTFSILFTNELGHVYTNDPDIQHWFGGIIRSCFTLFSLVTLEGWIDVSYGVWEYSPLMVVVIILFITLTTYAIINCVTAVIVQNVVDRAICCQEDDLKDKEKMLEHDTLELVKLFAHATVDSDASSTSIGDDAENFGAASSTGSNSIITKEDFMKAASRKETKRIIRLMDIDIGDLSTLFDQIDLNQAGYLNLNEFVQGILQMRGPARARRLFEFHLDFTRHQNTVEHNMGDMKAKIDSQGRSLLRLTQAIDRLTRDTTRSGEDDEPPVRKVSFHGHQDPVEQDDTKSNRKRVISFEDGKENDERESLKSDAQGKRNMRSPQEPVVISDAQRQQPDLKLVMKMSSDFEHFKALLIKQERGLEGVQYALEALSQRLSLSEVMQTEQGLASSRPAAVLPVHEPSESEASELPRNKRDDSGADPFWFQNKFHPQKRGPLEGSSKSSLVRSKKGFTHHEMQQTLVAPTRKAQRSPREAQGSSRNASGSHREAQKEATGAPILSTGQSHNLNGTGSSHRSAKEPPSPSLADSDSDSRVQLSRVQTPSESRGMLNWALRESAPE